MGNPDDLDIELQGTGSYISIRGEAYDGRPLQPQGVPPDPASHATVLSEARVDPGSDFFALTPLVTGTGAVIWQPPMEPNTVSYQDDYSDAPYSARLLVIGMTQTIAAVIEADTAAGTHLDGGAFGSAISQIRWSNPPLPQAP